MKTSEQINEITKAVSEFQGSLRPVIKDGVNPYFKSGYSSFKSIWESIRESLKNNGLAVFQDATSSGDCVAVTTMIAHISGQFISFGPLEITIKKDAHAVGSATSYGKRYSLCAALGIVSDDDDDGNQAVESAKKVETKISSSQVALLKEMIDPAEEAVFRERLRKSFNSTRFEDIPASHFNKVYQSLKKENVVKVNGNESIDLTPGEMAQ